jgi:hypothetical protein
VQLTPTRPSVEPGFPPKPLSLLHSIGGGTWSSEGCAVILKSMEYSLPHSLTPIVIAHLLESQMPQHWPQRNSLQNRAILQS